MHSFGADTQLSQHGQTEQCFVTVESVSLIQMHTNLGHNVMLCCIMQGRAEGGSGVPLDRDAYEESVAFWDTHAAILAGQKPSGE